MVDKFRNEGIDREHFKTIPDGLVIEGIPIMRFDGMVEEV